MALFPAIIWAAAKGTEPIQQQKEDWELAKAPNGLFVESYLQGLTLGTSYSPERARELGFEPLKALRVIHQGLGINHYRIGLRWSHLYDQNGYFTLREYGTQLEYGFKHGMKTDINGGPYKIFGWPEEHIPGQVLASLRPQPNSVIKPEDELAKRGLEHLDRLCDGLVKTYGKSTLNGGVTGFQLDNEAYQPFGHLRLTVSDEVQLQSIAIKQSHFPQIPLLINSAGFFNVTDVSRLMNNVLAKYPQMQGKLIFGLDHYDHIAGLPEALLGIDEFALTKAMRRPIFPSGIPDLETQLTEIQFVPWEHLVTPGNSIRHARFILKRVYDNFLKDAGSKSRLGSIYTALDVISKYYSRKATPDHHQIVSLIQTITRSDQPLAQFNPIA